MDESVKERDATSSVRDGSVVFWKLEFRAFFSLIIAFCVYEYIVNVF